MPTSWQEIEAVPGFEGAEAFAANTIKPLLGSQAPIASHKDKGLTQAIQWPVTIAFFGSFIIVRSFFGFFPGGDVLGVLSLLLMPFVFIVCLVGMAWTFKDKIVELIASSKANFIRRSKALRTIGEFLNLTYIPAPGGAPSTMKSFSKWVGHPAKLEDLITMLEQSGGLDDAIDIAQRAGLMLSDTIVLASEDSKQKAIRSQIEMQNLQDGFTGSRAGIPFDAFEWVQMEEQEKAVHHLVLVLPTPMPLQCITELRSGKAGWPYSGVKHEFEEVDLGARVFKDVFRIRSTDQTEARAVFNPAVMERVIALAGDDNVRAVAFPEGLVIDIAGTDRFGVCSLETGLWSDETILSTFGDIASLLQLVEASAHSFMVPKTRD